MTLYLTLIAKDCKATMARHEANTSIYKQAKFNYEYAKAIGANKVTARRELLDRLYNDYKKAAVAEGRTVVEMFNLK